MSDPIAETSRTVEADLSGLQTSAPAELREARRHAAMGPAWLKRLADGSRGLARVTAPPVCFVNGIAFVFYPRGWNASWSLDRRACEAIIGVGGSAMLLSMLVCLLAGCLSASSTTARTRPLWPAVYFLIAAFLMILLKPGIG